VFAVDKFAAQPWQLGILFVVGGVAMAVTQGALVPKLVPRFGEKRMAITSLVGQAILALLIVLAPALWMLYPLGLLQSAVTGFIFPTMATLTTNRVTEREQGTLAGVNAALAASMSAAGPLFAGIVYDGIAPGAPYWIGAAVLLVAVVLMTGVRVARPVAVAEPTTA
jgi:DHA1 family tetracycline resistance protein-like MFS transporter